MAIEIRQRFTGQTFGFVGFCHATLLAIGLRGLLHRQRREAVVGWNLGESADRIAMMAVRNGDKARQKVGVARSRVAAMALKMLRNGLTKLRQRVRRAGGFPAAAIGVRRQQAGLGRAFRTRSGLAYLLERSGSFVVLVGTGERRRT